MIAEFLAKFRARAAAERRIPLYRSSVPRRKASQDKFLALTLGVILTGALVISGAHAEGATLNSEPAVTLAQSAPSGKGDRPGKPPREALEACANAKAHSACSFSTREGETVKGKCMSPEANVPLACTPANMKKG